MDTLLNDPRTKNTLIDVDNDRGNVILKGNVDREEIREAVEEIARSQDGVITVINEIIVS